MRNVYIYLSLLLLLCAKGRGQGSDIVFLVDNSGSIGDFQNPNEYNDLQGSIASLMTEVLECNPENKISVVQYSRNGGPRIFIETDFVSTPYIFPRRYFNASGDIPGSVGLLANALNSIPNAGITSPQTTLTRTPGNELVVYLFTDAPRNNDLVTGIGAGNPAFASYTNFKNTYGATFIVTLVLTPGDTTAAPAAASIASEGGAYTGAIEGYPSDPDGQFDLPRYLLVKTDFNLSPAEIEIVTDDICSVAVPECVDYLTLISTTHDVYAADNRQTKILLDASNDIFSGGVGIYHSEQTIVLTPGFHSANGSRFRAYIDGCNTGYVGRPGAEEENDEVSTQQARLFSLSPNPASESVQISSSEEIQSLSVTSFEGKVIFSKNLNGKDNSFELYVRDYINGFYTITVTTVDGKVETQKLIKN